MQIAFDLLDKSEAMLGYERDRTGKGFEALLRRRGCLARLREAFATMPGDLGPRLGEECGRLFDGLYAGVRANTADYRLTPKGATIARGEPENLVKIDDEKLVASVCRTIRNSSHGLLELLREGDPRLLLSANTGGIPAELAPLAALIALGLAADGEGMIDGSWQRALIGG